MKKLIAFALVIVFCIPMMALARRDTGPPEWTFDNVSDLADWRDTHDLAPINAITKIKGQDNIERNVLRIVPTGDKPYVYLGGVVPSWEPFGGYEHATIYLGVHVQKSDTWQVDYITGKNTEFNDDQSKKFTVNFSQDFEDVKFDMHWDGMIRGLRLHLGSNKNTPIEIDYISLLGPVTVVQPPKKLATTWGKVKDLF
jgi:hypothetical protein